MKRLFHWPQRNKSEIQSEVDEEIRFHLDMRIEQLVAEGRDRAEARDKAQQEFGDINEARRNLRRADLRNQTRRRRSEWFLEFFHDLKYAGRTLRRSRTFAAMAMLTLALGIAATTIVFSFTDGVLFQPLPFRNPDRLMRASGVHSPPDFVDMREALKDSAALAAYHFDTVVLTNDNVSDSLSAVRVTPGFFEALGVAPVMGRSISEQDAVSEQDRFVVLSDQIWRRHFAADATLVGKTVRINGEPYAVIGVMPPGFAFPASAEAWLPKSFSTRDLATQRGAHYLDVIGRLRVSFTLQDVKSRLAALSVRLQRQYPDTNARITLTAEDLKESIVGNYRRPLLVLLAAGFCLLLIACANIAGLTLVRTFDRAHELALRAALGAGRSRMARALLAESIIVAAVGGAAGVVLAFWGIDALVALEAGQIPRLANVQLSLRTLAFASAITALSAVAFGLAPVLRLLGGTNLAPSLAEGGRSVGAARSKGRLQTLLVGGEVALTLVLLAGAGLLLRTFVNLRHVDLGFSPQNVMTFDVSLPKSRYPEPYQSRAFFTTLADKLGHLPGVVAAGSVSGIPLTDYAYQISVEKLDGGPAYKEPGSEKSVQVRVATPDYFRTMGLRLVHGRLLEDRDSEKAPLAAIVSESAARMLWPNQDPLGHSLELGTRLGLGGARVGGTVVGVVADYHNFGVRRPKPPMLFVAHAQFPVPDQTIAIQLATPAGSMADVVRNELRNQDPELPLANFKQFSEINADALAEDRSNAVLVGLFAGFALALAAIGIYGITAYSVTQRMKEFGVRMALGASAPRILRMVLQQTLRLVVLGVMAGLAAAVFLTRSLQKMLFALSPADPLTLLGVAAGFLIIAAVASWLPARTAGKVDPMTVLRES
jgi:putative ABC transport system permease protein